MKTRLVCIPVIGMAMVVMSTFTASAATELDVSDMHLLRGGAGSSDYYVKITGDCWTECSQQSQCNQLSTTYCNSGNQHEACQFQVNSGCCRVQPDEPRGCGDIMRAGSCTSGRCQGGEDVGDCPRHDADPC